MAGINRCVISVMVPNCCSRANCSAWLISSFPYPLPCMEGAIKGIPGDHHVKAACGDQPYIASGRDILCHQQSRQLIGLPV